jgi:hypothetical protein
MGNNGQQGAPRPREEGSLLAWGETLKSVPPSLEEYARRLEAIARSGRESHVVSEAVTEQIAAAAAVMRRLGADSEGWFPAFNHHHETDRARVETPRHGSRAAERNADVTAAERDGF